MSKLLLLDFDGVINACSGSVVGDTEVWPEWATVSLQGTHILYSPNVVRAVNALSSDFGITVRWLSTWEERTEEFGVMGFDRFEYLTAPVETALGHWKVDAAVEVLDSYRTAVWCEDSRLVEMLGEGRADLFLRTDTQVGLRKEDFKLMAEVYGIPWVELEAAMYLERD